MKRDFQTVQRQVLTAEKALRNLNPDSESLPSFQKVYDEAKRQYEEHPGNPSNRLRKKQQAEKKF